LVGQVLLLILRYWRAMPGACGPTDLSRHPPAGRFCAVCANINLADSPDAADASDRSSASFIRRDIAVVIDGQSACLT
jgi:hypothetical protein